MTEGVDSRLSRVPGQSRLSYKTRSKGIREFWDFLSRASVRPEV